MHGHILPSSDEKAVTRLIEILNDPSKNPGGDGYTDGIHVLTLLRGRALDRKLGGIGLDRKNYKGQISCCEVLTITPKSNQLMHRVHMQGDSAMPWSPHGHQGQPLIWLQTVRAIRQGRIEARRQQQETKKEQPAEES